ncbi:ABC transporter permease [Georgenia subflava]|nr:ABC transporter permease [Georgenia subflava]
MILKGMLARKLRLLLSAGAVLLGVAFVTSAFTLGDTIAGSFDRHIAASNDGVGTVVTAIAGSGFTQETVPADVVATIGQVDGVAAAEGATSGFAQLRPSDGADVPPATTGLSVSWLADDTLNPLALLEGRAPTGRDEVVVDPGTADALGLRIGSTTRLVSYAPARDVEVVGLATLGDGGISVLGIEAATAAEVFGYSDEFSEVRVRAVDGVADTELRDRVDAALAQAGGYSVRTGSETSAEQVDALGAETGVITTFLLVFAGITLFVAGFLIVNTFAMLTSQRTGELALLRALGASRGQVLRTVILEAVLVGGIAGVAGLGAGLLVAQGLTGLLGSLGLDLPETSLVVAPRTLVVALLVGPVVTAVAALLPAQRAAAVEPVEAMREAALPVVRNRGRAVVGSFLAVTGAGLLVTGVATETTWSTGAGALLAVLAVTTFGPLTIGPVTRVLGRPLARLGGEPARLARQNVRRSPRRSAATAAALMIGLALVSGTTVLGSSLTGAIGDDVADTLRADVVVDAAMGLPFGPDAADAVEALPEVGSVASITLAEADVASPQLEAVRTADLVTAMDPAAMADALELPMVSGSVDALRDGSVLVSDEVGLDVGDDVSLTVEGAAPLTLEVSGVYRSTALLESVVLTESQLAAVAPHAATFALLVTGADAVGAGELERTLDEKLAEAFPLLQANTAGEFAEAKSDQIDEAVAMITVLLLLSLLVALLGVVNTLTLSVIERTREVGMLRAVGMSRRQLRTMVRTEAVLMAAYGALVGVAVGTGLGWVLAQVLVADWNVGISVPALQLGLYAAVTVVAAVGAAALPARRAGRMDVLAAVRAA